MKFLILLYYKSTITKRSDKQWLSFKEGGGRDPPLARYVSQNGLTIGGLKLEESIFCFLAQNIKRQQVRAAKDHGKNFQSRLLKVLEKTADFVMRNKKDILLGQVRSQSFFSSMLSIVRFDFNLFSYLLALQLLIGFRLKTTHLFYMMNLLHIV